MKSSGLPCPADTGYACLRSRGGWKCCYRNRTGRRAAHSVFLLAASAPQQPDHRGGVVDGTKGAVLGHFAQTALKSYNRPPISAVVTPASARRRMRCVSRSVPLRKSAATGDGNGRRRHARHAGEYGRAIFDTWMRRQLIDIGETVVNNAFGAAPEYGKSGARQRSFARPSASATRAATVVLRLRLPNDLPDPVCSWCFCGMLKAAAWH